MKKICPICNKIIDFKEYKDFAEHISKEADKVDAAKKAADEANRKKQVEKEKRIAEEKRVAAEKEKRRIEDLNEIRKYYEALKDKIEKYNINYKDESITISMSHKGKDVKKDTKKDFFTTIRIPDDYWDDIDDYWFWI